MPDFEITIIGAGVVGLAIAARLSKQHPQLVVLEKNEKHGMETSSRNSEVIHAGIYYPPGSLKAKLCVEGRNEMYAICRKNAIGHRNITKLITAASDEELPTLEGIYENGMRNGVDLRLLDAQTVRKMEPNIHTAGAIYSPSTGIVSAHELMNYFYHTTIANGATIQNRCEVTGVVKSNGHYTLSLNERGVQSSITSEIVINSAGLYADHVAALVGIDIDSAGYRLSHAKGSYFAAIPSKAKLLVRLVYPVPTNESLGIHALLDLGGRLRFGPDIEYVAPDHFDYSVSDAKRTIFARSIRRILPMIGDNDITPDMAGIRAKLQRKGEPQKDFLIVHEKEKGFDGFVNLIGIDSPGLTASPAIARYVERLLF